VIWKSIAKKAITAAQAKKLLEKGKTDKIKGFKSKAGKDFEAVLTVKSDFSVGFEF
jgi:DNA topoisomerase-3